MKPNWFIGIPFPAFDGYGDLFDEAPESVRRFHPDDLHITVAFLGPVAKENALKAWAVVDQIEIHPFDVCPGAVHPFGRLRRPSAFSMVLKEGHEEVSAFISDMRPLFLETAGARPDTRPPRPHITIARPPRRTTNAELKHIIRWARQLHVPPIPVRLNQLALYTWAEDRTVRQFQIIDSRSAS